MVNKIITAVLLVFLAHTSNPAKALELSSTLEENLVDDIIRCTRNFKDRFIQEGMLSASAISGPFYSNTTYRIAMPLIEKMVGNRYLCRSEYNFMKTDINRQLDKKADEFSLKNLGFSARYIKNPELIVGGYLFYDRIGSRNYFRMNWMINTGIELIWPQYDGIITVDCLYNPPNLLNNQHNRFYQGSIKIAQLKPEVLDLFCALSFDKQPGYSTQYAFTPLGFKGSLPIKWYDIKNRMTVGAQLTYIKKAETWTSLQNLEYSIYIQLNLLKSKNQNSLQDYLRMPIDRYIAIPSQPSQSYYPKSYSPSLASSSTEITDEEDRHSIELIETEPTPLVDSPRTSQQQDYFS